MRYAIFSDIHSNLEAFTAVIMAYRLEAIDRYYCLGDVVGYGANPNECIDQLKSFAKVTVAGNHDWASIDLLPLDYFNPQAKEVIYWTKDNLTGSNKGFLNSLGLIYKTADFTLVHGTLDVPEEFDYMDTSLTASETTRVLETDLCFVGHTHVPGTFVEYKNGGISYFQESKFNLEPGNKYIVDVGSVGQPRDHTQQAAYCIYDSVKKEIQIKRVSYDVESVRARIIQAGLPRFFGDRLLSGT